MPSTGLSPIIRVACGVLRRASGEILITQRPAGKIAAGRWEFPGGKIEAGESPYQALCRELQEELGIEVQQAQPLIRLRHAYTDRTVQLDVWVVSDWQGELQSLDQQAMTWTTLAGVNEYDLLEADGPILTALRLPSEIAVTPVLPDVEAYIEKLKQLSETGPECIRFRAPNLSRVDYVACIKALEAQLQVQKKSLCLDRWDASFDEFLPLISAVQLSVAQWQRIDLKGLDLPASIDLLLSCHSEAELAEALKLKPSALVLGHVLDTPSHANQPALGWDGFAKLVERSNLPVYGIGGLSRTDLARLQALGAQGFQAIRAFG